MELIKAHLTRQWDLIPEESLKTPVTIIGAGAIGSWVALQLAKMGVEDITVWDPDTVSVENMSCQMYGFPHIGMSKVEALVHIVRGLTNVHIEDIPDKWKASPTLTKGIVVLAVDCMQARREIFDEICDSHFQVTHVIDARMGAEHAALYVMNPNDAKDRDAYEKTLYSNTEAVQERCTAKATIYTANLLSGLVVKAIKDLLTKQPYPRTLQYAIGQNAMTAWRSDGSRC